MACRAYSDGDSSKRLGRDGVAVWVQGVLSFDGWDET
jgi:hypothetical protein